MIFDFTFPAAAVTRDLSHGRLTALPRGQGPAVLFVHGGFHGAWCFASLMRLFAARRIPCAAVDLRGHGGLPQTADFIHQGVAEVARDVAEGAAALGGEIVLAGHSLGALVALAAARSLDSRGLVMLAPAPPGNLPQRHSLPPFADDAVVAPPPAARARKWLLQGLDADTDLAPYLAHLCPESPALLNDRYSQRIVIDPERVRGPRLCMTGTLDISPLHPAGEDAATADFLGAEPLTVDAGHGFMLEESWCKAGERLLAWLAKNNLCGAY